MDSIPVLRTSSIVETGTFVHRPIQFKTCDWKEVVPPIRTWNTGSLAFALRPFASRQHLKELHVSHSGKGSVAIVVDFTEWHDSIIGFEVLKAFGTSVIMRPVYGDKLLYFEWRSDVSKPFPFPFYRTEFLPGSQGTFTYRRIPFGS